jgi:transcriptional regulator of stress and heat shock response
MSNLANIIESYIRRLLDASPSATILLQRKELADRFSCVPSQINYVLSTRFTFERGYLVDSRRGGGGYLRIRRLDLSREKVMALVELLRSVADEGISAQEALDLVDRLAEARLITRRESLLMKAAMGYERYLQDETACEGMRSDMLARMLEILLHES